LAYTVREIQPTPNPNAMKYILDRTICDKPASFYHPNEAQDHPLAAQLLAVAGVSHVMLLGDFVTVGKEPAAHWSDINKQVKRILATS
jgi:NFU1 iron-sulfur cluster scaffold homolog, mitochondrial